MAQVTMRRQRRAAFVVDEDSLRRLDQLLAAYSDNRIYKITIRDHHGDDVTTQRPDPSEVIAIPNSGRRPIVRLQIEAEHANPRNQYIRDRAATIDLDGRSVYSPVQFDLDGEDDAVHALADRLDEWLGQISQWYTWVVRARTGSSFFDMFALFVVLSIVSIWVLVGRALLTKGAPLESQVVESYLLYGLAALALFWVLAALSYWLLPAAIFATGNGARRYERLLWWRGIVGIAIGLGMVVAVVAGLIVNGLSASGGH